MNIYQEQMARCAQMQAGLRDVRADVVEMKARLVPLRATVQELDGVVKRGLGNWEVRDTLKAANDGIAHWETGLANAQKQEADLRADIGRIQTADVKARDLAMKHGLEQTHTEHLFEMFFKDGATTETVKRARKYAQGIEQGRQLDAKKAGGYSFNESGAVRW